MKPSNATAVPAPVHAPERPASLHEVVRFQPKRPDRRGWWLLGTICVLLAAGVAWRLATSSQNTQTAALRTSVVRRGPLERTMRLSGVTVAQKFSNLLTPQLWGSRERGTHSHEFTQVLQKLAPAGSYVHKGDIVAEFDRLNMLNRMDDYKAWVDQHRANVRKLNALLDVKRKSYEQLVRRVKADMDKAELELGKAAVLSAIKVENNRLNLEEAKAKFAEIVDEARKIEISEKAAIRATELELQRCQVEYDRAQRNVDRMVVRAPLDGMVVMQTIRRGSDNADIEVGDQLYPGQPYMQIVDLSSMEVEASLNQVDIETVRIGQRARVNFDAYPGLELPARVMAVTAFARSRGWRGNYVTQLPVRLQLEAMDPRVIPNFSVSVNLILDRTEDALLVPRESLFYEEGRPLAFVRTVSGWEQREVEVGRTNFIAAAVNSGLGEGDVVATERPSHAIVP